MQLLRNYNKSDIFSNDYNKNFEDKSNFLGPFLESVFISHFFFNILNDYSNMEGLFSKNKYLILGICSRHCKRYMTEGKDFDKNSLLRPNQVVGFNEVDRETSYFALTANFVDDIKQAYRQKTPKITIKRNTV
ncbi:hypothetical protein H8356DRAFT_1344576 [Neocallimastix lanati (nom. inval.)]|nr:hypothetical protein H8356DRAFT_1344576 [Neocallimastix sp. JGI-2020a]